MEFVFFLGFRYDDQAIFKRLPNYSFISYFNNNKLNLQSTTVLCLHSRPNLGYMENIFRKVCIFSARKVFVKMTEKINSLEIFLIYHLGMIENKLG